MSCCWWGKLSSLWRSRARARDFFSLILSLSLSFFSPSSPLTPLRLPHGPISFHGPFHFTGAAAPLQAGAPPRRKEARRALRQVGADGPGQVSGAVSGGRGRGLSRSLRDGGDPQVPGREIRAQEGVSRGGAGSFQVGRDFSFSFSFSSE